MHDSQEVPGIEAIEWANLRSNQTGDRTERRAWRRSGVRYRETPEETSRLGLRQKLFADER